MQNQVNVLFYLLFLGLIVVVAPSCQNDDEDPEIPLNEVKYDFDCDRLLTDEAYSTFCDLDVENDVINTSSFCGKFIQKSEWVNDFFSLGDNMVIRFSRESSNSRAQESIEEWAQNLSTRLDVDFEAAESGDAAFYVMGIDTTFEPDQIARHLFLRENNIVIRMNSVHQFDIPIECFTKADLEDLGDIVAGEIRAMNE